VKNRAGSQDVDQWNVEYVPQGEEAFEGAELGDSLALF
jgi:hypothetical protein